MIVKDSKFLIADILKNKLLIRNFFSLTSVQIANYILPLIVLPYLARVIGVEKFGTIAFAQAIVVYFIAFTAFGFNFYAPREISIVRENRERLCEVFWNIMYSRILLCLISAFVYISILLMVPKIREEFWVFLFTFGYVIGCVFFPMWFFLGMEKMTYIALFSFLVRISYVVSIFVFIRERWDYIFVPLLFSVCELFWGAIAIRIIIIEYGLKPISLKLAKIYSTLKSAFILFISNISIEAFTKIPTLLLGFLASKVYVGYYSAAEKLFFACLVIQSQLAGALYPHISKMVQEKDRETTLNFIKTTSVATMSMAVPLAFLVFIFAKPIITIIYGEYFLESFKVLRLLSILFIVFGISNILGIQTMLPFNMKKEFFISFFSAGLLNFILGFVLIPKYKHLGACFSFIISGVWVILSMFFMLCKKDLKIFTRPITKIGETLTHLLSKN